MIRKYIFQIPILTFLLIAPGVRSAEVRTETVKTSEPPVVSLKALFAEADIVAFIKIHSGDAESYNEALYKAEVTKAYKGAREKEIIYFGPYIGYGAGETYLVFLKRTDQRIAQLIDKRVRPVTLPYDATQTYSRIMYVGYSVMPVSYECVFGGPGSRCDFAVKFNIYQVRLPATLPTFPKDVGEFSPSVQWVRRRAVEAALTALKNNRK